MIESKSMENQSSNPHKLTSFETKEDNLHFEGVLDIEPKELANKTKQVLLIDVRQPEEFHGDLGHIPGAKLIVLDTLTEHLTEIPKDQTVVFVCRSGSRSARAAAIALEEGCQSVFNLKGGMILWNELHLETEI